MTESSGTVDEYADLPELFARLEASEQGERTRMRDKIIARCLPIADHIALRFTGRGELVDDLTQVARLGLVNAVDRFDASRGSNFLAYAVPTIMGEVRRHFRDNTWATHVPRRVKETQQKLSGVIADLTHTLGRSPTTREIAATIEVPVSEVNEAIVAGNNYRTSSINASMGDGPDDSPFADVLGEVDQNFAAVEDVLSVAPGMSQLSEREREIVKLRFYDSQTQSQIAEKLGISQMQVSRLLTRILQKLRRVCADEPDS